MQGTGREVLEGQWQYCLRLFHQWNSQWSDDDLETWENEDVLKAHMASEHFTTLVPKIEALTKNGLKLEQFTF